MSQNDARVQPPPAKRVRTDSPPAERESQVAFYSSRGKKLALEDVVVTRHALDGGACRDVSFHAVLDGHGGSDCANWAAARLPELLSARLAGKDESAAIKEAVKAAFAECDQELLAHSAAQNWDDGTCVIGLLVDKRCKPARAYVSNLGDSRAFAAVRTDLADRPASAAPPAAPEAGSSSTSVAPSAAAAPPALRAVALSKDHTAIDPRERKRIEAAGGHVLNGRVNGLLAVSRSLGDRRLKRGGVPGHGQAPLATSLCVATPDVTSFEIGPQQAFVLLGCDSRGAPSAARRRLSGWRAPSGARPAARRARRAARRCQRLRRDQVGAARAAQAEREGASEEGVLRAMVTEAVHGRHAKDNVTALLVRLDV